MCGIVGFFGMSADLPKPEYSRILGSMTEAVAHRGPDAVGRWFDQASGIGLGHSRLSIVDLSPAGAQPMQSQDERWIIAYNGEVYNTEDLRSEVVDRRGRMAWQGHSDTEVLLELVSCLGPTEATRRLDGMFALALYDRIEHRLFLARDAFGEKPLYYGLHNKVFFFASELKALLALRGFHPEINLHAAADFCKYGYVPAPATIYHDFFKLPSATFLEFGADDICSPRKPQTYWDMVGAALAARSRPFSGSLLEAVERVNELLLGSVKRRKISDVPIGLFLSGGIDSSIVTALMQACSSRQVETFSVGMAEDGYNEAKQARLVSRILGTNHNELVLTPEEVQRVVPEISAIYDEPFSDSSQVPTFLVSRLAREKVGVVLSGDGGDELFGGYNRYFHGARILGSFGRIPMPVRRAAGLAIQALPMGSLSSIVAMAGSLAPRELTSGRAPEKLKKIARLLNASDELSFHDRLLTITDDVESVLSLDMPGSIIPMRTDDRCKDLTFSERAMLTDTTNYLPDDVLVKVDRASMAVGLEVRTPFLNREIFDFAWSLPQTMRTSRCEGKQILRELLYRKVPRELVDKPKAGFAAPMGRWLRQGLRDWAEDTLSTSRLSKAGLFNVEVVRRRWSEHLAGKRDHETFLWSVLMFQGWLDTNSASKEIAGNHSGSSVE